MSRGDESWAVARLAAATLAEAIGILSEPELSRRTRNVLVVRAERARQEVGAELAAFVRRQRDRRRR